MPIRQQNLDSAKVDVASSLRHVTRSRIHIKQQELLAEDLFLLSKNPSTRRRRTMIRLNTKLPGRIGGDFNNRAAFVTNMATLYGETVTFLKKYGHLYLTGNQDDLKEFCVKRDVTFNKYLAEMKPYLGGKMERRKEAAFTIAKRALAYIFVPEPLFVINDLLEPMLPNYKQMEKEEFKRKTDMITDFLFGKEIKQEKNIEDRLRKLRQVARAASAIAESYAEQHEVLSREIKKETIHNILFSGAKIRLFYTVPENLTASITERMNSIVSQLPANRVSITAVNQHDVTIDNEESMLRNSNLAVRLREETNQKKETRNILCIRTRFPHGSLRMRLRSITHRGIGTGSKFYSSEIDIPLPATKDKALQQEHMNNIQMLFFSMGIKTNIGSVNFTPEGLKQLFAENGFIPETEYKRKRIICDIAGQDRIYLNTEMSCKRAMEDEWINIAGNLRIQLEPKGRKPDYFELLTSGLEKSRTSPFDTAISNSSRK